MDVQLLNKLPIEIKRKIFFFCLMVLACDGSGGVQPMKNLLLALAISGQDVLFEVARQVYFEKKEFYLGMGGKIEEKLCFDTFHTFLKDIRLIRNLTVDLPQAPFLTHSIYQCYQCAMDGGHPSQRFGFHFTLCARHNYVQSLKDYIDNSADTSFVKLDHLQILTIQCMDGFAPLAIPLTKLVVQNSKLLQRVVVKLEYSGSTDKLHPLYEHYQNLIAAIDADFVGTKGSMKEAQGGFEEIWVWDLKSGVGKRS